MGCLLNNVTLCRPVRCSVVYFRVFLLLNVPLLMFIFIFCCLGYVRPASVTSFVGYSLC
jgi:hypothetical protein